jgi:hypothetical protein
MNTNTKGRLAELLAISRFIELGYIVLEPVNKDGVYDFVVEKDNIFSKVQVKKLRLLENNSYELSIRSATHNRKVNKVKTYTKNDVDFIIGVDIETKNVYKIAIEDCNKYTVILRKGKPLNNQIKGIKFCEDYLI